MSKRPDRNIVIMDKLMNLFSNRNFWTKGQGHSTKMIRGKIVDCYCLAGGVDVVVKDFSRAMAIRSMMTRAIESYIGKSTSIISFNDKRSTKFEDIQAVLRITKSLFEVKQSAKA